MIIIPVKEKRSMSENTKTKIKLAKKSIDLKIGRYKINDIEVDKITISTKLMESLGINSGNGITIYREGNEVKLAVMENLLYATKLKGKKGATKSNSFQDIDAISYLKELGLYDGVKTSYSLSSIGVDVQEIVVLNGEQETINIPYLFSIEKIEGKPVEKEIVIDEVKAVLPKGVVEFDEEEEELEEVDEIE